MDRQVTGTDGHSLCQCRKTHTIAPRLHPGHVSVYMFFLDTSHFPLCVLQSFLYMSHLWYWPQLPKGKDWAFFLCITSHQHHLCALNTVVGYCLAGWLLGQIDASTDSVISQFSRKQTVRWRLACSVFTGRGSWDQYLGKTNRGEGCQAGQREKLSCRTGPTTSGRWKALQN